MKTQSRHDEMMRLAARALQHFEHQTTDLAPEIMSQPVAAYIDPARYQAEREGIFKHLPLALALTLELPKKGDYKAMTVLDTPIIIARNQTGEVKCFLNACRHRGSRLCDDGCGAARVFSCPYHAWTYDAEGALIGRYGAETFGEIDTADFHLTELPCAERCGLIWVTLTPSQSMDIDAWLGDFAEELDTLALSDWHLHEVRVIDGPGWKVTLDGYLEAYHHNLVHGATVGQHTVGNLLVLDTYGPHQRLTFGRKTLGALSDQVPADWAPADHIRLIHSCFPNLSISGILGDHCLVSQIFPGPSIDSTQTIQFILSARAPNTENAQQAAENFSAMVLQAVRDEDYRIGFGIQESILTGANQAFVFGRNEPAVQNYHRSVARFMAELGKTETE
ncbi:MAG: aromatic ring-hydroxylating dioxygenase subunit alpha [Pseudomonadales bacterium]|nr:aromatic ring-hydroxylating dioxygenase subunit alpha [Pseudomonadales bacterium]